MIFFNVSVVNKWKNIYCGTYIKHRKFQHYKISYILNGILVLSNICHKCCVNKDAMFKRE